MEQIIIIVLALIICIPLYIWIFKVLVIDLVREIYKGSRTNTPKEKAKAILKSIVSGLLMTAILGAAVMCGSYYDLEPGSKYEEYNERREPGW